MEYQVVVEDEIVMCDEETAHRFLRELEEFGEAKLNGRKVSRYCVTEVRQVFF